jgi:hypothetical protein
VPLLLLKQLAHATHAGGGTKPHILMVVVDDRASAPLAPAHSR